MKKLVIFGTGDQAELATHYFRTDSEYDVAGFAVDAEYRNADTYLGEKLVDFENVETVFPSTDHSFFIALGYSGLNKNRKDRYLEAKNKGYRIASYISSKATIAGPADFGENCFILEDNTIQPFVKIGNNVTLWSGNHIGHHSVIADHCFLASHIVVSGGAQIGEQCFIGVNATLRDRIVIGARCVVGAGAILLSDADPDGVYLGSETERSRVPSNRLRKI